MCTEASTPIALDGGYRVHKKLLNLRLLYSNYINMWFDLEKTVEFKVQSDLILSAK